MKKAEIDKRLLDLKARQGTGEKTPCPRCGRPWFGRPWYHPAPFLLCRHRCAACGLKAGEDPSTPEED